MTSLALIADKAPIVSTFGVDALRSSPLEVRDAYDWHAATYVEQPPLTELRQKFIAAVLAGTSPKACLVAPFGYGKTATAIGIWHACRQVNLLAVPPISCGSFAELARAVFDWLIFSLPEHRTIVEAAHDRFLASSADAMARRDERQFGIPFDQALAAIRDKLERGYLDFEDLSINLLAFLEEATALSRQAGYQGLVIAIDEMQQLLGNANKGVLVALRQLIWGLRTRHLPIGLLLTMDPDTERTLSDRAGDIIHRIKDDGLYLDVRHVYDREFPARLWQQYTAAFALDAAAREAIDRPTLDALGELCERDDLSNGPRTVINVLQLAAKRCQVNGAAPYSPIDLVDDFLSGAVRFDGDRSLLPALVAELLNFPYFQRANDRARALKLIGAFPRGCPEHIAGAYGLADAWRSLADDLRGEILTELDEGLALIELQRVGRPANGLNILLRRYWMQVTDQQLFAEDAARAFTEIVVPLIFPAKMHDLSGYSGVSEIDLSAHGGYTGMIEGTSSSSYPLRRLGITVQSYDRRVVAKPASFDADYSLVFCLDSSPSAESTCKVSAETNDVVLNLALSRVANDGLRGGLAWIEHYLSPQPVSAAVVLSLLRFLSRETTSGASARDQARIEDTVVRLQEWLLAELLPSTLFRAAGFDVFQAGANGLHEFLYLFSKRRWPNYHPFAAHPHWLALMRDYQHALAQVSPAARLGETPVRKPKADIAALFGQTRHAGFETRVRQYGDLLRLEEWRGAEGSVRFVPHPAEVRLAEAARTMQTMPVETAYHTLRAEGFAGVEVEVILQLAQNRSILSRIDGMLTVPKAPLGIELMTRVRTLETHIQAQDNVEQDVRAALSSIVEEIGRDGDTSEIAWRVEHLEQRISQREAEVAAKAKERYTSLRSALLNALPGLIPELPHPQAGDLENHLRAVQQLLEGERLQLRATVESLVTAEERVFLTQADALLSRIQVWAARAGLFERWNSTASRARDLRQALERLRPADGRLADLSRQTRSLIADLRSVLAQTGIAAFAEIGQFESRLAHLRAEFDAAESERSEAYTRVASDLCLHVSTLAGLAVPLNIPPYDPHDDEQSFWLLVRTLANTLLRSVALMSLGLGDEVVSKNGKQSHARLRSDLRSLMQRLADPDWVVAGPQLRLRSEAIKAVSAIRVRALQATENGSHTEEPFAPHLARVMSELSPDQPDIMVVYEKVKDKLTLEQFLTELVALQKAGLIRLSMDLPGPPNLIS